MKTTIKEEWKNIKGYEGLYQASTLGNIRSMNYRGNGGIKKLKTTQDRKGYLCVSLYKNGNKKVHRVHRLIAETFIENPNNALQVNHIDGIKQNNEVLNLEWVTQEQNIQHAYKNGLINTEKISNSLKGRKFTQEHKKKLSENHADIKGSKHPRAKSVMCITTEQTFSTIKEGAECYKISTGNIRACCKGKTRFAGKHPITRKKLVWRYVK